MDIADAPFDRCLNPHTPEDCCYICTVLNIPGQSTRILNRNIIDAQDRDQNFFRFIPRTVAPDAYANSEIHVPCLSILNSILIHAGNCTDILDVYTPVEYGGKTTIIYRNADPENWLAKIVWSHWFGKQLLCTRVVLPPPSPSMSETVLKVEKILPWDNTAVPYVSFTEKITFPGGQEYRWHAPRGGGRRLLSSSQTLYQMDRSVGHHSQSRAPCLDFQLPSYPTAVAGFDRNTCRVELKVDREFEAMEVTPGLTLLDLAVVLVVRFYGQDDREYIGAGASTLELGTGFSTFLEGRANSACTDPLTGICVYK
ncbi:hypothetical protein DFP72DRAFT_857310 [Ephemerocybe angulata]|uniref:Uncharacterized protein n=1 Tax=Ephemerocybe angulata TaxID=980116 RepID=A0A8H6HE61_9AGAR|nr:hypothetical protein DFP72DRAFT_857310 [Tulosesus angulatus]